MTFARKRRLGLRSRYRWDLTTVRVTLNTDMKWTAFTQSLENHFISRRTDRPCRRHLGIEPGSRSILQRFPCIYHWGTPAGACCSTCLWVIWCHRRSSKTEKVWGVGLGRVCFGWARGPNQCEAVAKRLDSSVFFLLLTNSIGMCVAPSKANSVLTRRVTVARVAMEKTLMFALRCVRQLYRSRLRHPRRCRGEPELVHRVYFWLFSEAHLGNLNSLQLNQYGHDVPAEQQM